MTFEIDRIYNENCLDTMRRMPNGFVDLVVTSPPYDNLRKYNGYSFDFESIAKELYRIVKFGGVVVWVVGDATIKGSETGTSFRQALFFKSIGFNLHDTMIYEKQNYVPLTHNRYEQSWEYMFVFSVGRPSKFNPIMINSIKSGQKTSRRGKKPNDGLSVRIREEQTIINSAKIAPNIFKYRVGHVDSIVSGSHTAPFPEKLANDHIISWSNDGDLVYDPFMGSGTTAKMALLNNRHFVGSEISAEYCEIANRRISNLHKE